MFENIVGDIVNALYGYILIILLIIGGLWFTFRTRFVQFRLFKEQFRLVAEKPSDGKGVSSFQALMVSTASRVGTGNIIGVSTAICLGGYGAVFWMWVIAIIGCASAFVESTLAQIYKKRGPNGAYGGPAYYIEALFKGKGVAIVFSIFLILTYGFGFNMLASYNLQSTFSSYSFYSENYTPWIIGLITALLVGYCLLGDGKRIIKFTSVLVPVMGVIYVAVSIIAVLINITELPGIFGKIFSDAFDIKAIFGGFSGSCVMYGIKRGLYSNEAGVGSAPNASASADVSHPVKQGLVQVLSVFLDTVVICSASAFLCLSSGVEPTEALAGAPYVQEALKVIFGGFGPVFITVAMILFAFTTLLGNLYYVDMAIAHILGFVPPKKVRNVYHTLAALVVFIGAGMSASLLWDIADITMGLMTIINMPVIIIMGRYAFRALKDYDNQRKQGKDPVFKSADIGIKDKLDYWE